MLDFGFSEILLTSAIALVVLGPERLPKVARQVGTWMGRARVMARQLSEQLEREVNAEELVREQKRIAAMLDQPVIKADELLGSAPAPSGAALPAATASPPAALAPALAAAPASLAPASLAPASLAPASLAPAPPESAAPTPAPPAAAPPESTRTVQ